jgi:hypothetical protein
MSFGIDCLSQSRISPCLHCLSPRSADASGPIVPIKSSNRRFSLHFMFAPFISALFGLSVSTCTIAYTSTRTVSFYSASFQNCAPALLVSYCPAYLSLTDCSFARCLTSEYTVGAVYFNGSQIQAVRCSFTNCQAVGVCALYATQCSSAGPSQWNLTEVGESNGYGSSAPLYLSAFYQSSGTDMAAERTNVTGTTATLGSSGITLENGRNVVFQFCRFESNTGINCIVLNGRLGTQSIRCLHCRQIISTDGDTQFKGMICIYASWTIADSVFEDNSLTWIAGQYYTGTSFTLTFENCYFDEFPWTVQGRAIVELDGCDTDSVPDVKDGCPASSLSAGAIAGIVIGTLAGIAIVIAIVAIACIVKKRAEPNRVLDRSLTGAPAQEEKIPPGVLHAPSAYGGPPPPQFPHGGPPPPPSPYGGGAAPAPFLPGAFPGAPPSWGVK